MQLIEETDVDVDGIVFQKQFLLLLDLEGAGDDLLPEIFRPKSAGK